MVKIKQLHEADFPIVVDLSLSIFKPKAGKNDRYHNIRNWEEYYKQKGVLLGAFLNNELVGYLFCYEREPYKGTLHCWMAGVAEKYRKQGILKKLMSELTKVLKERGYKDFTINTWPEKFPAMYAYLTKYDYEKYKEEEKDWEGKRAVKSFFRKNLEV
jgi:ribosomal protein S18 acetylase RimI-like enzyme